jgi:hypothetical protein
MVFSLTLLGIFGGRPSLVAPSRFTPTQHKSLAPSQTSWLAVNALTFAANAAACSPAPFLGLSGSRSDHPSGHPNACVW